MLKPPGTKRFKLKCDILLLSFAFSFNLRRYISGERSESVLSRSGPLFTDHRHGLTLVHFSAQLELCVSQENTLRTVNNP
jgi:hypothetical protein